MSKITGWQREKSIEVGIMERMSKADPSCFVFLDGRNDKGDSVDISYFWNEECNRKEFRRTYPPETANMEDSEVVEMFLMDWIFGS
jgi:hypothetical protein